MNTLQYILVDLGGPGYAFQSCPVSLWTHQAPRNQRLILGSTVAWVEKDGAHGRPSVDVDVGLPSPMCLRLIGFLFLECKTLKKQNKQKRKNYTSSKQPNLYTILGHCWRTINKTTETKYKFCHHESDFFPLNPIDISHMDGTWLHPLSLPVWICKQPSCFNMFKES